MKIFQKLYAPVGSWIIAAGWGWYHFNKHPKQLFIAKELALWLGVYVGYRVGKAALVWLLAKFKKSHFWQTQFIGYSDEFFFFWSLLFIIFFFKSELVSLVYVLAVVGLVYWRSDRFLTNHPDGVGWRHVNRSVFKMAYFLFLVQAAFQYVAYHYYILDSNIRFYNIVLFRAVAMTLVWCLGFALASWWYLKLRGVARYVVPFVWVVAFVLFLSLWTVNIGVLYYSGLYFSPVALEHASGAGDVVANSIGIYVAIGAAAVAIIFLWLVHRTFLGHTTESKRYWRWYQTVLALAALSSFLGLSSLRNTPEHDITLSFYDHWFGSTTQVTISPVILSKLKKFGLNYEPDNFYVNSRDNVFTPTSTNYLPDKFKTTKPNIVIIYLESFSARLSDVYSSKYPGVTPNLLHFSQDPHTTVFYNYFNASTPTITGTLSQLCSFLPPTGHNEIQNERKLQNHHLLCLPEVLKKDAGYKYANYITAVEKEFANKDGIFLSMGVDKIYGTAELAQFIPGKPLSWGYSDHQLFPALWNFMEDAKNKQQEPFLMMLATVDTHPPFNLAKDAVNYQDASRPVLNMFHTTDDAFGQFWQKFKNSPYYDNTILIAVADHAIFPSALTTDLFPEEASRLSYYDPNLFLAYIPDSKLPKEVKTLSSGIDQVPTLLQILNVNIPNSFEGLSILDDRQKYPNILGMHELGLYINQQTQNGKRSVDYDLPTDIVCAENYTPSSTAHLTECDYLDFYHWKRQMFEQGRFWKH